MDAARATKCCRLVDEKTSDVVVQLRNSAGRPEFFYCNSAILVERSIFFADRLSHPESGSCIEIHCSGSNYDHHVNLLRLICLPSESVLDSLDSVESAIAILEISAALGCEEIKRSCIQYLEAVPWEDKEEEEILQAVSKLGPMAMPILSRVQQVDLSTAKSVFVSALQFAMSIGGPCPPFSKDIKISAQEQVEYMLDEDEDIPLVMADDEIKSVARLGLLRTFSTLEDKFACLILESDMTFEMTEANLLQCASDLEWMCSVLPKMGLMKEFVLKWAEISNKVLQIIDDKKLESLIWGLKVKLIEVTGKVLDAVGYGNVILPAPCRVQLLKTWLPYIRKLKPLLEAKGEEDVTFPFKMDDDLCQSIEGSIVSLVLALPSNDQADILADWMNNDEVRRYPDLSEAFEVWCYRTKSAKRRLEGLERPNNDPVSL